MAVLDFGNSVEDCLMNTHPDLPPLLAVLLFLLSLTLLSIGLCQPGFVPLALGVIGLYAALVLRPYGLPPGTANQPTVH